MNDLYKIIQSILKSFSPTTTRELKNKLKTEQNIIDEVALPSHNFLNEFIPNITVKQLEHTIIENARCFSMGFFVVSMFKDVELNWHHIEWFDIIQSKTSQKFCIEASRDLGKTFFFSELHFVWRAYRYNSKSVNKELAQGSGLIFSQNSNMASRKLEFIKKRIVSHPVLKAKLFPDNNKKTFDAEKWNTERIITRNGYDLSTIGFNSASRGHHVYHIVLDDILENNALYSLDYRNKLFNTFFADIEPQMKEVEGGILIIIGTPLHSQDLYGIIKDSKKELYQYREYPAIMPDGRITWPWKQPKKFLERKKLAQGSLIFAQEFLCRPISDSSSIFPYKYLNNAKDFDRSYIENIDQFDLIKEVIYVVSGSDFAKSASASADDSCHIVFARTNNNHLYCLWLKIEKGMGYFEQMGTLRYIDYHFLPNLIALESNGFQKIFEENYKEEYKFSTVKGYITGRNKNDYQIGLPSLAILFERGLIHFPYKTEEDKIKTDTALSQFNSISFTDKGLKAVSGHDDIPFSSYIAKQAIDEIEHGMIPISVM